MYNVTLGNTGLIIPTNQIILGIKERDNSKQPESINTINARVNETYVKDARVMDQATIGSSTPR